jgi:tRNA nucleotidyltransferase/poly(A) polymerase
MAISLNENDYGKLLDPFNGINDLNQKMIRTVFRSGKDLFRRPAAYARAIRLQPSSTSA